MSTHRNCLYSIRLLYSTYAYNCGMLGENCTKLLLSLDGVESFGDQVVRAKRKALVKRILSLQDYATFLHVSLFYCGYAIRREQSVSTNGLTNLIYDLYNFFSIK